MSDQTEPHLLGSESTSTSEPSRLGRFIQTYHGFLSSFVIGAVGLIATSVWQYRQSEIAHSQADAQQEVAKTQADNNWKIEKAKILANNLQTLSAQGPGNVEQKYGVLLSLTRGNILDPELAVSYALELGKENPEYMRSVLHNTHEKDYWRLARAFEPTCEQRYGVTRPIEICQVDKLADRSAALAQLISDESQAALNHGQTAPSQSQAVLSEDQAALKRGQAAPSKVDTNPLMVLTDEHLVQTHATRLAWLFTPTLINYYERRQWNEISKFEATSTGAQLVASLVLAAARTGEFVSGDEAARLEKLHSEHRKWLTQYMIGSTCDNECRAKLMDVMLTSYEEAEGDYDLPMRALLEQPRAQAGPAVSHLHTRLLWCQVDGGDLTALRDKVLVPATTEMFGKDKPSSETLEDLVGLMAITKPPKEGDAQSAWRSFLSLLEKPSNAHYAKIFSDRRAAAARERASPARRHPTSSSRSRSSRKPTKNIAVTQGRSSIS